MCCTCNGETQGKWMQSAMTRPIARKSSKRFHGKKSQTPSLDCIATDDPRQREIGRPRSATRISEARLSPLKLAIVVNLEPRRAVALERRLPMPEANLRLTHRQAVCICIAQDHPSQARARRGLATRTIAQRH